MRKVTILFNPNSGRRGRRRDAELNHAIGILQSAGVHTDLTVCRSSQEATDNARCAVADGSDTVFACGGDGTIHDVIQALAGTPVALAILPFGTANALAHDLRIPFRPSAAARAAVAGKIRRIPLGRIEYEDFNRKSAARYFTVAAGIGVDAHLFYKLTAELKKRGGMTAYYFKAWQLWATHRMRKFEVEYANGNGLRQHAVLTELLAVRIRFFGNILRELVPGASLDCGDLRTVMCRTASRNAYIQYVAGALLGRQWDINGIDLVSCSEVVCQLPEKSDGHHAEHGDNRVYVEADGELLGRLPARMTMQPDALSLVVPA
ncbi:MAG: diacylglycerol kinase family protein [Terriglobales bacterium]|jgi:diacylglycerol kinase family enzyme